MRRTQIYLPEELHHQLLHLAKLENISMSEIIRKTLIASVIKKQNLKKKNFFEVLENLRKEFQKSHKKLPKDLSTRHTEYYLETVIKNK